MRFSITAVDISMPADFPLPLHGSYEECARSATAVTTGLSYLFDGRNMSAKDASVCANTVERIKRQLDFAREGMAFLREVFCPARCAVR